jgi:hypothetical protein
MSTFKGEVEAVSNKKTGGWSVKIGELWLSGRDNDIPLKGSVIEGDYESKQWNDKIFHNIKRWSVVTMPTIESVKRLDDRESRIERQAALKISSTLIGAFIQSKQMEVSVNDAQLICIQMAESFIGYIKNGKGDL